MSTDIAALEETAREMVAPGKGILAADESKPTMSKRLEQVGVEPTEESRRQWRELLFTAEGIEDQISGVILFDETMRQTTEDGTPFPQYLLQRGILPGIKVDTGAKPLAGSPKEKITEGLDGLRERLAEYREMGARFCKWRAVITIGDGIPTDYCVNTNAHALARYAALCQEAGLVPIVEPECLMDGDHTIERSFEVTTRTLHQVFHELWLQRVAYEGMVLKPNMVMSGYDAPVQAGPQEVADWTLRALKETVPPAVPGIAFLSGGQSDQLASAHLNLMNRAGDLPWQLTYSYGRALLGLSLETWRGEEANVPAAQAALQHRARLSAAARRGEYSESMEQERETVTAGAS
ncbi:MAG TPA: class I fructose-bisphosphate aldolase [Solirubrobacteraceae bacterium]|nr:class I fructose-bisphosphate aldolase [Solirubrobacteraceae bacterium]